MSGSEEDFVIPSCSDCLETIMRQLLKLIDKNRRLKKEVRALQHLTQNLQQKLSASRESHRPRPQVTIVASSTMKSSRKDSTENENLNQQTKMETKLNDEKHWMELCAVFQFPNENNVLAVGLAYWIRNISTEEELKKCIERNEQVLVKWPQNDFIEPPAKQNRKKNLIWERHPALVREVGDWLTMGNVLDNIEKYDVHHISKDDRKKFKKHDIESDSETCTADSYSKKAKKKKKRQKMDKKKECSVIRKHKMNVLMKKVSPVSEYSDEDDGTALKKLKEENKNILLQTKKTMTHIKAEAEEILTTLQEIKKYTKREKVSDHKKHNYLEKHHFHEDEKYKESDLVHDDIEVSPNEQKSGISDKFERCDHSTVNTLVRDALGVLFSVEELATSSLTGSVANALKEVEGVVAKKNWMRKNLPS